MDYTPFKIPSHLAGDFSYRFVIPPFRKKSRLLRLFACKRAHNASAALPTFCGMHESSNCPRKMVRDSFCLTFTKKKRRARQRAAFLFCPFSARESNPRVQNPSGRTIDSQRFMMNCCLFLLCGLAMSGYLHNPNPNTTGNRVPMRLSVFFLRRTHDLGD